MEPKPRKCMISLSGGLDSATLLAEAVDRYGADEVVTVGFNYQSKHNKYENVCAENVADYFGVPFGLMRLDQVMAGFKSDLLLSGGAIPEGHYEDASMSRTVVPGRNIIFASILAGLAWSRGSSEIWMGIHQGDHAIYEDCRPQFFNAMNAAIRAGTGDRVSLVAPFIGSDKVGILRRGLELKVPYELTRTCYSNSSVSCGRCGACVERCSSFHKCGLEDPVEYQDREFYKQFV